VTAYETIIDALRAAVGTVRDNGGSATAQCPAHDDRNPSLSIGHRRGGDGAVVCCHAGCDTRDVMAALNLTMSDLFDEPKVREIYAPSRTYAYLGGRRVHRKPDKSFPQSGDKSDRSLFHADRIGDAATVYVPEGEKDVEAVEAAGGVGVCSAMGAGKAYLADWTLLRGRHVVIVADKDKAGREHAADVVGQLDGIAASARVVEVKVGKDFADHFAAGHGLDDLVDVAVGTAGTDGTDKSEDGEGVLNDVEHYLARFVSFPSVHALIAYVLWIAHTWLMDAWESTPRIAFLSPEPGSGKTRALEVAEPLVPRPVHAVNCTPAYLFRKVGDPDGPPTILYDEIDTVFGPKAKDNEDIRGLLNAGHRKGAVAGRCVVRGKTIETEEIPAYCAVALAGLHDLPDTIMTRSIPVRMRRRKPDERVEPWRGRINGPQGEALGERLQRWAHGVRRQAGERWPEMPDGIEDRDADVWEPLLAVADLAGGRWPAVARRAAVAIVKASKGRTPSLGIQLLRDVRRVFEKCDRDMLPTIQLLAELVRLDESPWAVIRKGEPLDARGLASRLKDYGIESKNQRDEYGAQFKGYAVGQFADAWARYVPAGDDQDDDEGVAA